MEHRPGTIEMIEATDPEDIAAAQKRREQFDRNSAWLQAHFAEVYTPQNRGRFICIAGEDVFVSESLSDAVARATAAHPSDHGWFTRYIPKEKVARVYAS